MFEISVKTHFSAAHHLRGYDGLCANPHGHNWEVEVFVRGENLDGQGFLVDFQVLKRALRAVLNDLDHHDINTVPAFAHANPTSENLARYVFETLSKALNSRQIRVWRVAICEAPGSTASYWEGA